MITVYIVEDNEEILFLQTQYFSLTDEFKLLGYSKSGKHAIENIPLHNPDVVLMDIGLPDISGIECIKALKPQMKKTEFVVFTISDQDEVVFDAINAGATSYLMKTTSPEALYKAIREVNQGGSPISSDIARKIIKLLGNQPTTDHSDKRKEFGISKREEELLTLLSQGLTYQEAADKMFISISTLKSHIYNTYEKLQVNNKVEAINKFFGKH